MSRPASVRVVGVGQRAAGDDAVGLVVLGALRERSMPEGVELHALAEPSGLVPLLGEKTPIILVDAVLEDPPGQVLELSAEELAAHPSPLSSHGFGVADALALGRALAGRDALSPLHVVAISIARPERHAEGLSRDVARAVPHAVARVLARIYRTTVREP